MIWGRRLFLLSVIGIAVGIGLYVTGVLPGGPAEDRTAAIDAAKPRPRPEFVLNDVDQRPHSVAEWDDRLLVVNFWATWCAPCREEIPVFVELQQLYRAQGLQFLGIAIDDAEAVRRYIDSAKINYPVLIGDQDAIDIAKQYGNLIGALPYTAIVDRNKEIVFTHQGAIHRDQIEAQIQALL